jgi:hypothetical protein
MTKLVAPIVLLLCSFTFIPLDWVVTKIDNKLSLELPAKPDKEKSGTTIVYSIDNDGCVFIVTVSPLPASLKLPDDPEKNSKFLDGVLDGGLKATNPDEVEKKDVTTTNAYGKEASYIGTFPGTEARMKATKRILLVDHTLYVFDFWIVDEEYANAPSDKEKFFNSIKVSQ